MSGNGRWADKGKWSEPEPSEEPERRIHPRDPEKTPYTYAEFKKFSPKTADKMWKEATSVDAGHEAASCKPPPRPPPWAPSPKTQPAEEDKKPKRPTWEWQETEETEDRRQATKPVEDDGTAAGSWNASWDQGRGVPSRVPADGSSDKQTRACHPIYTNKQTNLEAGTSSWEQQQQQQQLQQQPLCKF